MANRFDKKGGSADLAAIQRKRSKTTPEKIDDIIDSRPIQKIFDQKLERKANAVGNPAYPALGMYKALLLQSWYSLSDRELSENLEDLISFSHFSGVIVDASLLESARRPRKHQDIFPIYEDGDG